MNQRSQPVRLYRHNPLWGVLFWIEKGWLWLNLQGRILGIAHVGSTAIRGMPAKLVIDISVGVADYEQAWDLVEALKGMGYRYLGENPELREYSFEKSRPYTCALIICEPGGEKWQARIRFRDYLRAHPQARREYAELKRRLAQEFAGDLLAYQRAKLPFVQEILTQISDKCREGGSER